MHKRDLRVVFGSCSPRCLVLQLKFILGIKCTKRLGGGMHIYLSSRCVCTHKSGNCVLLSATNRRHFPCVYVLPFAQGTAPIGFFITPCIVRPNKMTFRSAYRCEYRRYRHFLALRLVQCPLPSERSPTRHRLLLCRFRCVNHRADPPTWTVCWLDLSERPARPATPILGHFQPAAFRVAYSKLLNIYLF